MISNVPSPASAPAPPIIDGSSAGLTSARLGNDDSGRCIPGLESPYPAHASSGAQDSGDYKSGGYERSPYHADNKAAVGASGPSHAQLPPTSMKVCVDVEQEKVLRDLRASLALSRLKQTNPGAPPKQELGLKAQRSRFVFPPPCF